MAYYVYSLESHRRGDSNENTQYTIMLKKIEKISLLYLIKSNYHCLELIFMAHKVFEPLKFYCTCFRSSIKTVREARGRLVRDTRLFSSRS